MRRNAVSSEAIIDGVMLTITGMAMAKQPSHVFALELVGDELGLHLENADTSLFDVQNMYPGDTETASMSVSNKGELLFTADIRIERTGGTVGVGDLYEQLQLIIKYMGEEIYNGPMDGFSSYHLGTFQPGVSRPLDFLVHLPGPETGNEFQGSTLGIKLIFTATREPVPETPSLVITKKIIDPEGNDISHLAPHNQEKFFVSINGGEAMELSVAEPIVLTDLTRGDIYTITELEPTNYDYARVTDEITVTINGGTEYVTIVNELLEEIIVEPEDPAVPGEGEIPGEGESVDKPELPRTGGLETYLLLMGLLLLFIGIRLRREKVF